MKKTAEEIVNESGYPLQILVEHLVKTSKKRDWNIVSHEFPWVNPNTNEYGFIDLLQENQGKVIRMIIECKRYSGDWIFLSPESENPETKMSRILRSKQPEFKLLWQDNSISPQCYKSNFCVMINDGTRDSRTLEKIVSDVLLSLESVAMKENDLRLKSDKGWRNRVYIPVVVTTADIKRMAFNENDIDNGSGKIDTNKSKIQSIPYVRFVKSFPSMLEEEYPNDFELEDIYKESERTIFVIQAKHFIEFLDSFSMLFS